MTSFTKSLIIIGIGLILLTFGILASQGVAGTKFYRQEATVSKKKCPPEMLDTNGDCVHNNHRYESVLEDSTVVVNSPTPYSTNFNIVDKPVETSSGDDDDTDDDDYDRGYYGGNYSGGSTGSGK